MNKIIGTIFIIIGIILIGIGTYKEFNEFGKLLVSDNQSTYHDGLYITSGDSIYVSSQNKDVLTVVFNERYYEFVYNGKFYEDKDSGFYINFTDDELSLYKGGELIRTLHKK